MCKIMKQYEVLNWASLFLEENNCENRVAEILLQHHLGQSRSKFFMEMQTPVAIEIIANFKKDITAHIETGVPVQHLIGHEEFYGRQFIVNENTLIPRPETEEVILHTLELIQRQYQDKPLTIIDVGTGSGVIGITLALELPNATVYASDISEAALAVAKQNAEALQASVTFLKGDFLEPLINLEQKVDIIISNPPYIAKADAKSMDRTVIDFDPALALFAENDGLASYEKIMIQSKNALNKSGSIVFEIGHDQGETVPEIIQHVYPHSHPTVIKDINRNDRTVITSNIKN